MHPETAATLLASPRRQKLLEHIWQRTSLSRAQFATLYLAPLERYAELVQLLPASEGHHHAHLGGMLDHGLEVVAFALKLRQSHLLPAGATPEAQAAQGEAWTAAVAYAALLHDVGKVAVDVHVEYADGTRWHPWHGALRRPYRFRYRQDREYRLHCAATGLLYAALLDRDIMDWLAGYPELWTALLYLLAGQHERAGILGDLVTQADQASVAQALGGDPAKALTAPRNALQRKLLDGLRYLLREELKLNQPQASDGWLTHDALWLVSKTVSDKLRAYLLSQGVDGIPTSNSAVFNVLQDHGIAVPTADGKAIWKATVTSATGWSHSFTFLRISPAAVWDGQRPATFDGTVCVEGQEATAAVPAGNGVSGDALDASNGPLSAVPQPAAVSATEPVDNVDALLSLFAGPEPVADTTLAPPAPTASVAVAALPAEALPATDNNPSGEHFLRWLKQHIASRKLVVNDAKALVHTVADTAYLVSPGIFQRYAQEHLQVAKMAKQEQMAEWQWVQKQFERLRQHQKQANGLNIWTCEVTGPRKSRRLHGYLLCQPCALFNLLPPNNPHLRLMP
ncbi:MobH family relaxase [Chitinimonas koreensis]|uniref:MobH family relaxase n=1 Tax=Chitinimonas koreensis TaxID=356302 RepID=UPI00068816DD|nr:MobH family relaxase [Chitinimonas koreensis]QNM96697.1 TraI domain-containing protein [Chitinimonas koreensis]